MIDFEAYDDLPWFDEIGSDGQEFRLSQQLADEGWVEETDDIQIRNMTKEEYEERLKEIEENAENELKETIEIMSAVPGARTDEKLYTVTERRKKKGPAYDQTRLDGISQLWGLPPEDPSALSEYEPPEKIDDVDFNSVSQLWGGSGFDSTSTTSTQSRRQDESEIVGMGSFAGISELWGSTLNDFQDDNDDRDIDSASRNETIGDAVERRNEENGDDLVGTFSGLPWHDERGPDGKEYRLSELLADEEWVTETETEEVSPMSLEDYNKQVEEIITQAEEELRETEAILLSKPGTDPVGWDYDDEDLAPMSNVTNSDENEEEEEIGNQNKTLIEDAIFEDADLAILEMDIEVEEDPDAVYDDSDKDIPAVDDDANDDTNPAVADRDEGTEKTLGGGEQIDPTSNTNKVDDIETVGEASSKEESDDGGSKKDPENSVIIQNDPSETESTNDDDTTNNKGRDKIEPIFLEEQENSMLEDADEEDDLRL